MLTATGVPGNPNLFYFGSVGGGVWKTLDAGQTWRPIFDSQPVASIGAIAVAPSDPNVIYVGSGEAAMRSSLSEGNGLYKSVDAGAHWKFTGLADTRQIGRIIVDPANANRVFVAALGHAYGPSAERGVYRSEDGGATWSKVFYKNADTGAIDIAFQPDNANIVYASLWQTRRPPWNIYPPSNGPGSGLYKSTDGGATWQQLTNGFPSEGLGHIGIAVAPSNPHRIYAIVDAKAGGLYRSDDAGATWKLADGDKRIWQRGWYFCKVTVDPKNADVVYVSDTGFYRSTNGGASFTVLRSAPGGDDYQGVWVDPVDTQRMILASDQGVVISTNNGASWTSWLNQPTAQFYHVVTDNRFPYWIYGAQQDSGAVGTPSRSNHLGISLRDWMPVAAGGESGYIAPDPDNGGILYGGTVDRFDQLDGQDRNITPELVFPNIYRHTWTLPAVFSPQRPRVLYYSTQVLFRSTDRGASWHIISPDLTRHNPGVPSNLDPATAKDVHGAARQGVIYAIAPSPVRRGTIWTGTDDGTIHLTHDEGAHWSDVTPPALTAWSKVGIIEASHYSASTAYAAVDRHRLEDNHPYIYRTRDSGRSWQFITNGIPNGSFVNSVREDPKQRGLLFAGTESGVYVSFDDGTNWHSAQLNMPTVSVRDLVVHEDDLVIATFGRSFWVLDSISPLRDLARHAISSRAHLYPPSVAYRVRPGDDQGTPLALETAQGENPPSGAYFDYYLASAATTPLILEVFNSRGKLVRRYASTDKPKEPDPNTSTLAPAWLARTPVPSSDAGMHRFVWNFHAGGQRGDGSGPLAPPGLYTLRMSVNGQTQSQHLTVRKDPRVHATDADLQAEFDLTQHVMELRESAKQAYAQATELRKTVKDGSKLRAINAIAGGPPPTTPDDSIGAPDTSLHSIYYLGQTLQTLAEQIDSADGAPTPDMRKSAALYESWLTSALTKWNALRKTLH